MARHERDGSVTYSDDDQLHERELVTLNAVALPKLTCINIHALASLSGEKERLAPGWARDMWLASSHLRP
jgi:hypothetical protein